ncbi:nucleoside hydrolase [Planomonospora alba]|uniref:Nucleoside hydrolase n=1 Tax=Planomonospora alba TaxID=161354 RepID=A0ABP6NSJ9_9ACTN
MAPTKVIVDCDPGVDDALALAFALGSPELEVLGVTTVAGNVSLERATGNALRLREFLGAHGVPVVPGSPRALVRDGPERTGRAHGPSGLGAAVLPEPLLPAADGHAADFIAETVRDRPGEVVLIAIGPLTNVALALRQEPRVSEWARDLVVVGGPPGPAAPPGAAGPDPGFNLAADPEAAAVVFGAGRPVTAIGLGVSARARAGPAVRQRMRALGRLGRELLVPCVESYGRARGDDPAQGPPVHDACAVARVVDPRVVPAVPARVTVDTGGPETAGTAVAVRHPDGPANALVATGLDAGRCWELALAAYGRLAARLG